MPHSYGPLGVGTTHSATNGAQRERKTMFFVTDKDWPWVQTYKPAKRDAIDVLIWEIGDRAAQHLTPTLWGKEAE